jgi:hypothetical protein
LQRTVQSAAPEIGGFPLLPEAPDGNDLSVSGGIVAQLGLIMTGSDNFTLFYDHATDLSGARCLVAQPRLLDCKPHEPDVVFSGHRARRMRGPGIGLQAYGKKAEVLEL